MVGRVRTGIASSRPGMVSPKLSTTDLLASFVIKDEQSFRLLKRWQRNEVGRVRRNQQL